MQKSLHGLDNITAEGAEAFDGLMSIIETLMENGADKHWAQTMREALKEAKRPTSGETKTAATTVLYML